MMVMNLHSWSGSSCTSGKTTIGDGAEVRGSTEHGSTWNTNILFMNRRNNYFWYTERKKTIEKKNTVFYLTAIRKIRDARSLVDSAGQ